jgi:hypothetical protein
MYVTVVLLVLAVHWLHSRKALLPQEYLAGAADEAVAGIAGGLSNTRRAGAQQRLRLAGDIPGAPAVKALLTQIPHDPGELIDPTRIAARQLARLNRIWSAPLALSLTIVWLTLQTVLTLVYLIALGLVALAEPGTQLNQTESFASIASGTGAAASAACVILAFARRRDASSAYSWLQRAILIDLLVTRVFAFALIQFGAIPSVLLDLAMLAVLAAAAKTVELGRKT